jgi:hypothetical protein
VHRAGELTPNCGVRFQTSLRSVAVARICSPPPMAVAPDRQQPPRHEPVCTAIGGGHEWPRFGRRRRLPEHRRPDLARRRDAARIETLCRRCGRRRWGGGGAHAAALSNLLDPAVEAQARVAALQRTLAENLDPVRRGRGTAAPPDPWSCTAHLLDQPIGLACREAIDVSLLDYGDQGCSARRCRCNNEKYEPESSFGIASSISPARVSKARREPARSVSGALELGGQVGR